MCDQGSDADDEHLGDDTKPEIYDTDDDETKAIPFLMEEPKMYIKAES
jgi:hypothetical protein